MLAQINEGAAATGDPIPIGQASPQTACAAANGIEFKRGLTLAGRRYSTGLKSNA